MYGLAFYEGDTLWRQREMEDCEGVDERM